MHGILLTDWQKIPLAECSNMVFEKLGLSFHTSQLFSKYQRGAGIEVKI